MDYAKICWLGWIENNYLFLFSSSTLLQNLMENGKSTTPTRFKCLIYLMMIVLFFAPASPQADVQFVHWTKCAQQDPTPHTLIVGFSSNCTIPPRSQRVGTPSKAPIRFFLGWTPIFDRGYVHFNLKILSSERILALNINKKIERSQ